MELDIINSGHETVGVGISKTFQNPEGIGRLIV